MIDNNHEGSPKQLNRTGLTYAKRLRNALNAGDTSDAMRTVLNMFFKDFNREEFVKGISPALLIKLLEMWIRLEESKNRGMRGASIGKGDVDLDIMSLLSGDDNNDNNVDEDSA